MSESFHTGVFVKVLNTVLAILEKEDVESGPFVDALCGEEAVTRGGGEGAVPRDIVWMAMRSGACACVRPGTDQVIRGAPSEVAPFFARCERCVQQAELTSGGRNTFGMVLI